MLRLRYIAGFALIANVLCAATMLLAQNTGGLSEKLDEAEKKLDADIKACKPINVDEYSQLQSEAKANLEIFDKAFEAGAPVNATQVTSDLEKAGKLLKRAQSAADNAKTCPPPQQRQAAPPPKPAQTLVPSPQAAPKDPFEQLEDDAADALDDLDDAMDDCDEAAVKALIPKLEELSKQAHGVADTARAAGKLSRIDANEADTMADELDKAILDAKKFKCLLRPKANYFRYTPAVLSPFELRLIAIHNQERSAVYARPLKWNFKLEWDAIGYADQMDVTHRLIHAPREGRGIERENLLQTNIGWTPDRMMQSWTIEKRDFMPGYYPNVARDGNWLNVSHYTQMIWPTTTDVGCGYAEGGGYGWLVCRYSPGGNRDGKPVGIANPMPERG